MPHKRKDPNSGAIIFDLTDEEIALRKAQSDIASLQETVKILCSELNELKGGVSSGNK